MPLRRALLVVLLLAACGGSRSNPDDLGSVSFPANDSPCELIERCVLGCTADGGTSCATTCQNGADSSAAALYDALASCIESVCVTTGDGGTAPCSDPGSVDCMRCQTNSAFKTPSECAGAASYCGACSTELTACFK